MSIELPDGSIEISFAGEGEDAPEDDTPSGHDDNLAETLPEMVLGLISGDLLDGIEQDDESRQGALAQAADFLELLGLAPSSKATGDGPQGMSKVYHPLLLEAVLRCQANASGELYPVDGPVKIRDDDTNPIPDELIDAYEKDWNHFLTVTASEYYPDSKRMLFGVALYGISFKKVYLNPIKRRPCSETVDMPDLIISNTASDIMSAARVTHVIKMDRSTFRRMQVLGAYRDVPTVADPDEPIDNPIAGVTAGISGHSPSSERVEDRDREIYECYCQLDIEGYEHKDENGLITGLPLPYKVTIDKTDRAILEIRRNWKEEDPQQQAKQVFVPFRYVHGPGFYGVGLGHILGNSTRAATAAWRILLDAGMFSNFPGGFRDKRTGRQDTLDFTVGVGQFPPVETAGGKLSEMIMPLPYRGPSAEMMQLVENIVQTASKVGGTAETNIGEGRADAPVGTTVALIEQAVKIESSVHKGLHSSQQREFELLGDLFREDPEAFWRFNKRPQLPYDTEVVMFALNNCDLVPVADPNTSSRVERLAKMQAVDQMASKAPWLFDMNEVAKMNLAQLQIPSYQTLLNPNSPPGGQPPAPPGKGSAGPAPPDPVDQAAKMMDAKTRQMVAMAGIKYDMDQTRINMALAQAKLRPPPEDPAAGLAAHVSLIDAQTRQQDAQTRAQALTVKHADTVIDNTNQALDRQSENEIAALNAHKEIALHAATLGDNEAAREADMEAAKLSARSSQ